MYCQSGTYVYMCTDKYGAGAKASRLIMAIPPNMSSEIELIDDLLNGTMALAAEKGDLDTVAQQSVALLGVLMQISGAPNDAAALVIMKPALEQQRDNLLSVVLNVASLTPPTGVFAESNLATAEQLTANSCELSVGAVTLSRRFVFAGG